jgi:lysophospholipase L1-like esterase
MIFVFRKEHMKRILVYGDSNTWGSTAQDKRIADDTQWTNILQKKLGDNYAVIQNGVCGRSAGDYETTDKKHYNGQAPFEAILRAAAPVDYIFIQLGTNDLKERYNKTTSEILENIRWYEKWVNDAIADSRRFENKIPTPTFVYLIPANIIVGKSQYAGEREASSRQELVEAMRQSFAKTVDLGNIDMSEDGIHFSITGHQQAADKVYEKCKELGI